eukprot:9491452-Pyramimonas_sp.AAC.1
MGFSAYRPFHLGLWARISTLTNPEIPRAAPGTPEGKQDWTCVGNTGGLPQAPVHASCQLWPTMRDGILHWSKHARDNTSKNAGFQKRSKDL